MSKHRHDSTPQRYRGLKRRRDRELDHINRVDLERRIFEGRMKKSIKVWVKDVDDNVTPTKYLIVEFNLGYDVTAKEFEEILYEHLGVLL